MNKLRQKNGVTITAMVIAIILLIILAAVSITAIRSSNRDIMQTAYNAKTEMEVASYQEELDIIDVYCASNQINNGEDGEYYIDLFKEEVEADTLFKNATVTEKSSTCLRIETEEGYVFYVYADEMVYAGISGEFTEGEDLTESDITFAHSPTDWTNGEVTVEITLSIETESTLQYSTDGKSWSEYTEAIAVSENTTIYARLISDGIYGTSVSYSISNIDLTSPSVTKTSVTTNSLTFTGTDEESGIVGYLVTTSSSTPDEEEFISVDTASSISETIEDLQSETTYYIYLMDYAGNISEGKSVTTKGMVDLDSSNVKLVLSTEGWTTELTIEIEITDSELEEDIENGVYIIEYSIDGGTTWEEYDIGEEIKIEENTEVEVRLSDGTNTGGTYTEEITNIDTVDPTAEISITDHTYNSITVEAIGNDDDSGIYSYEFQISEDGKNWETTDIIISSDTSYSYTYEELTQYTEYYVRVVVTDAAGNATTSESASVTTSVDLDTAIITLTPSTTEWTNETVTVTATTETPGVYIEMSTDAENWTETDSLTVSETCTIYARLVDEEGNSSEYALYKVTNIDTLSPTSSYEVSSTAESYSNYSTAGTITITSTSYDEEETETSGKSGLTETYYYSIDGGETYSSSAETEYTFTETSTEDDYEIAMYVEDEAGNISEVATETYTPITGDWVDYPIDINGDGDTTNDWRLFYINDDGIMFIIAADYMEYDSAYVDETVITSSTNSKYLFIWSLTTTYKTSLMLNTTNSLFMYTFSGYPDGGTDPSPSTMLNTVLFNELVDNNYANYAVLGATGNMFVEAWNNRGYTSLYLSEGSNGYGYNIGISANPTETYVYVTEDYISNSGYDDSIFFPYHSLVYGGEYYTYAYELACPSDSYPAHWYGVHYDGWIGQYHISSGTSYINGTQHGYDGERPVVALKSSVTGTYDSSTGIWTLSN